MKKQDSSAGDRRTPRRSRWSAIAGFAGALAAFAVLSLVASRGHTPNLFDRSAIGLLATTPRSRPFMAASWFGSYTSAFAMLCASIALAVYLWLRLTSMLIAVVAAIAPAAALATAEMLKALGGSGRVSVSLWGAPSGHVAAVVGAATCASFAAAVHPYKRLSRALAGSIAVLAALMTWARVSTQAHSASEAVGGVIVGLGIGSLATVLIDVDAARLDQVRRNAQAPVNT